MRHTRQSVLARTRREFVALDRLVARLPSEFAPGCKRGWVRIASAGEYPAPV